MFLVLIVRLAPVLLLFLASCKEKAEVPSKAEAMETAHKIDSSISNKRPRYFNELFDANGFARKIAKQTDDKVTNDMIQGVKDALIKAEFGDKIIQSLGRNGNYKLVKHYEKNNVHHLLFRLYSDDGLNYHDLELSKRNGKILITDMYIYMSGEDLSKTLSGLLISFSKKSNEQESKIMKITESVNNMRKQLLHNEYQKAMTYYKTLPDDIKHQRAIELIYLQICKGYGDDEYLGAMTEFHTKYPDDPNINLIMIDSYLLKKEYDKALEALNKLDQFIKTDPFLDFTRALINNMAEQPEEARKYLEQIYKNYPEFDIGVIELIANYINAGMDDKARELIKAYEKNEKFDQLNLTNYLFTKPQFSKN